MKVFSNPTELSSTSLGRSLLEWYCIFEDYYCFVCPAKSLLPESWRRENCQIRQKLAQTEYQYLSKNEYRERLLDDIWPQLYSRTPKLSNVAARIPLLKTRDVIRRSELLDDLRSKLKRFNKDFNEFAQSPDVLELLQATERPVMSRSNYPHCCLQRAPRGFTPHHLQYPPAGHLRLVILSIQTYTRSVLYPLVCGEQFENNDGGNDAYELCRTFAGLEHAFGNDQDSLLPCFSFLVVAGFVCPPELRKWLWHNLAHFEVCGPFSEPIKSTLSVYWDMPKLATESFDKLNSESANKRLKAVSLGDLDIASELAKFKIEEVPRS